MTTKTAAACYHNAAAFCALLAGNNQSSWQNCEAPFTTIRCHNFRTSVTMIRLLLSLFVGLVIGALLGLYFGWVQFPVEFVNSPMSQLAPNYRDSYTVMIANGFQADEDALGAVERLRVLDIDNVPEYVFQQAERYISNSRDIEDIQALIALSEGLGRTSPLFETYREIEMPGNS